jgi:predicted GNAT family N-acyltransferase
VNAALHRSWSADLDTTGLYAEHGFTPDGAEFVNDGISHTPMLRVGPLAAFLPHTIDTAS